MTNIERNEKQRLNDIFGHEGVYINTSDVQTIVDTSSQNLTTWRKRQLVTPFVDSQNRAFYTPEQVARVVLIKFLIGNEHRPDYGFVKQELASMNWLKNWETAIFPAIEEGILRLTLNSGADGQ